jgi:hypothetical protein
MKKLTDNYAALIDKLSNPIPLYEKGVEEPAVWCCGNCRTVHKHEVNARFCYYCAPKPCDRCGERVEPRGYCRPCSELRSYEKEQAAFEKAEKIEEKDYEGPVVWNNKFYYDPDNICYDLDDDEEFPKWAWACSKHKPTFDPCRILEWVDENVQVEDWDGIDWDDGPDLIQFVEKWFEKQTAYWWEEDCSRAVLLIPRNLGE